MRAASSELEASSLDAWEGLRGARATLLNFSENHTYELDLPLGTKHILRVHRPGYQDPQTIQSELQWIAALGADTALNVPQPIAGRDGNWVQYLSMEGEVRPAVLFAYLQGEELKAEQVSSDHLKTVGRYAATCHLQVRNWVRPSHFSRQSWDVNTMLGPHGLWGDWRSAPGVTGKIKERLELAYQELDRRFAEYGKGADRFGLVHADMRFANLLVDGSDLKLIDFDDCGFCWFIYDFAATLSFHELDRRVPEWRQAWLDGYAEIATLSAQDRAMIDPAILLRRMLLLAWIGTHMDAPYPQQLAPHFAEGTLALADRFLNGEPLS